MQNRIKREIKNKNSGFITTIAIIIGISAIAGYGIYALINKDFRTADHIALEEKIKKDLVIAKEKAVIEKTKLDEMQTKTDTPYFQGVTARDGFLQTQNAIRNIDIKIDANAKVTDLLRSIIDKKESITTLLAEWRNQVSLLPNTNLDSRALAQVIANAQAIQALIQELSQLASTLTPLNSDLTQEQIAVLETEIENAKENIEEVVTVLTDPAVAVTQEQVQVQINIVNEANANVIALEQELAVVQAQNPTPATPTPAVVTPETPVVPTPIPPAVVNNPGDTPNEPIVTDPGKPKLIQGTNND